MKVLQSYLDFFYPRKCIFCREPLKESEALAVCTLCDHQICIEIEGMKKLNATNEVERELEENEESPILVSALLPYESYYRKAILRWKYKGLRGYAKSFAGLMVERGMFDCFEEAVLMPIPLAESRMKKRGFNQALDLANEISSLTQIPVLNCLDRNKDTKPQSQCSREERYKNVQKSMYIIDKSDSDIKNILLIDDIYTTGSTIKEASRVIKKHQAFRDAQIYVFVVGKGSF